MGGNSWDNITCEIDAIEHGRARYQRHIAGNVDVDGQRMVNEEEIDAVYDMIELCRNLNAEPILITTPYLKEYVQAVKDNDSKFYEDYYSVIREITENTGVKYYDYQSDERFVSNYSLFFNTDHLNREGAEKFTSILLRETLK